MNGSDETILSTTRDMLATEGGATGLIELTDVETGKSLLRRVSLDMRGGVAGVAPAGPGARSGRVGDGGVVPAALAGLMLRLPAIDVDHVMAALAGVAPAGLRHVASDGTLLFALKDDPDRFDGTEQRLFRLKAKPARGAVAALDLAPLGLSGGRMITGLALAGDWLYAMVADATAGFDVFRARATARRPAFEAVLERGARRFALNAAVSAVAPCPGAPPGTLLLGTAALAGDDAPVGNWGPELLSLAPDGAWDIVMGQPRFTPSRLRSPSSARLPGFGVRTNAAVKAIASADVAGRTRTYVVLQDFLGETCADRRVAIPDFMDYMGGAQLYWSEDMVRWDAVAADLPEDSGTVTALVLTEAGVILGHEGIGDRKLPLTFVEHPA